MNIIIESFKVLPRMVKTLGEVGNDLIGWEGKLIILLFATFYIIGIKKQ